MQILCHCDSSNSSVGPCFYMIYHHTVLNIYTISPFFYFVKSFLCCVKKVENLPVLEFVCSYILQLWRIHSWDVYAFIYFFFDQCLNLKLSSSPSVHYLPYSSYFKPPSHLTKSWCALCLFKHCVWFCMYYCVSTYDKCC